MLYSFPFFNPTNDEYATLVRSADRKQLLN